MVDKMNAVIFLFSCILLAVYAKDSVPVVIWTNTGAKFQSPMLGHTTSVKDFSKKYLNPILQNKGHNIVAFLQDKFSMEDITDNGDVYNTQGEGGVYQNLKRLVEDHTSVHLPSVDSASKSIEDIKEKFKGKVHHLLPPYLVRDLPLDPNGDNLIVAKLPPTSDEKALQKIDNIMGSVSGDMKSLGKPYTALYTGERPSQEPLEDLNLIHKGRHLLAAEDDVTFLNVSGCIFFYTTNVTFAIYTMGDKSPPKKIKNSFFLPNVKQAQSGSKCENGTGSLLVTYTTGLPSGLNSFSYKINFGKTSGKNSGYWTTTMEVSWDAGSLGKENNIVFGTKDIYAPDTFSYHCTDPVLKPTGNKTDVTLSLQSFQIQIGPYTSTNKGMLIKNQQFGTPNDCTGFFSIPIWSGLITTLLLMFILASGLYMIANITTMDRFDDPKGKTITVTPAD